MPDECVSLSSELPSFNLLLGNLHTYIYKKIHGLFLELGNKYNSKELIYDL